MNTTDKTRKQYGITAEHPDVKLTGRYTISEVASILNLHRNTIAAAFSAGLLRPINPTAIRLRFSGKEIIKFWEYKTKKQ